MNPGFSARRSLSILYLCMLIGMHPAACPAQPCAGSGSEQRAGGLRVILAGLSPSPAGTGPNLWTVRVNERSGLPLEGRFGTRLRRRFGAAALIEEIR